MNTASLALRPCGDDDRSFCYAVKKAALRDYVEPIWGWDEEVQVEFHRKDWEKRRPEIITCDGRDIGTIEIARSSGDLHLGEFYLFPEFQRQGIGSYFMRLLVAEADQKGFPVSLEVIKINPVRSLYERFGFLITGETKSHYLMTRPPVKTTSNQGVSSCGPGDGIPTLQTARLILRAFTLSDAPAVQRLAGEWAIADTTWVIPHPYEDGMAEAWISTHEEEFARGTGVTFAIIRRADGGVIGAMSLMRIEEGHQAELGYWIGKPYWNQGYCTEAGRSVVKYAFEDRGLIRVHARHLSRNPASGRVMVKLGMEHEGRRRKHVRKWGLLEDVEFYGLLK